MTGDFQNLGRRGRLRLRLRLLRRRLGSGSGCARSFVVVAATGGSIRVEDDNAGRPRRDIDNAEVSTTSASSGLQALDFAESVGARVDDARQPHAGPVALNFQAEGRLHTGVRVGVDGVVAQFDVGVSRGILVGPDHIGRPVPDGLGAVAPDTRIGRAVSRRVDIVVGSRRVPVAWIRHSDGRAAGDARWNNHCLVSRKNRLADRYHASAVVGDLHISNA